VMDHPTGHNHEQFTTGAYERYRRIPPAISG
jgi:hypothetical protein